MMEAQKRFLGDANNTKSYDILLLLAKKALVTIPNASFTYLKVESNSGFPPISLLLSRSWMKSLPPCGAMAMSQNAIHFLIELIFGRSIVTSGIKVCINTHVKLYFRFLMLGILKGNSLLWFCVTCPCRKPILKGRVCFVLRQVCKYCTSSTACLYQRHSTRISSVDEP